MPALIRPASAGDEHGIALAHVGAWQAGYRGIVADALLDGLSVADRAAWWGGVIRAQRCRLLVAQDDGRICGFASFGRLRDEQASPGEGEIWTMYVDPGASRRGLGRALMAQALHTLRDDGFGRVHVWALQANHRAIAFYQSCGFALRPGAWRRFRLGAQDLAEVALVHPAR